MTAAKMISSRLERRLGFALSSLAFLIYPVLLWRGWGRWNDVLVDYGRELYVPWRLGQGDVLYRDLAYLNGPFSPHWNAFWFAMGGDSLRTLTVVNAVLAALFALLLRRVVSSIAGPIAAGASLLIFFPVFACGHFPGTGNYNFLSPYSHDLTHGLLLGLAALFVALRGRRQGQSLSAFCAGLLLGLCFLTKAEVFVASAGALLWAFLLSARTDSEGLRKRCALVVGGALVAPLIAFGALSSAMDVGQAARGTIGSWAFILGQHGPLGSFYGTMSGFDFLGYNLRGLAHNFGWLLLLFGPAAVLDRVLDQGPLRLKFAVAVAYACGLAGTFANLHWNPFDWMFSVRSVPLVALLAIIIATWAALAGQVDRRRLWADRSAFAVFALLMLLKILLAAVLCQYGFALTLCAVALLLAIVFDWLPQALCRGPARGVVLRAAGLAWLLSTSLGFWRMTEVSFASKTVQVGSGADKFWADPVRGEGVRQLLEVVAERVGEDNTLLVLPEGISVNYLSRRRSPTRHLNFMPPELQLFGEQTIRQDLREAPDPLACVLIHKDTTEYGVPLFGTDYGQAIMKWVKRRYKPDWLFGQPPLQAGTRFGIGFLGPR